MNFFVSRSLPPSDRDDNGRGRSPPPVPADFYLSALCDVLQIDKEQRAMQNSVERARKGCTGRNAEGLDVSLTVIRVQAETIRKHVMALQDKLSVQRADEIDEATQVYGV